MSTYPFTKPVLLLAGMIILGLTSCKKKTASPPSDSSTTTTTSNGTLLLHFHTNVDTIEVGDYNTIYTVENNRKISVSLAQLYVSGIELIKTDGSAYQVLDVTILKVMEVEQYLVGSVPAGNYKAIRFNVGLSPAANTVTPASNDSTLNRPAMWFGAAAQPSGFVFVNFQGKIDTTQHANGTAAQMQPFKYRIGTAANLKTVTMPDKNYSVIPGQSQFIHITIDYNKLFTGIALNQAVDLTVNTTTDNSSSLGSQVAGNIPSMFRYEE